ncbi:MAG: GatB/YqeY domain-containing protein, partial [Actinobacteria bacterium]|nr:GatB/YqeY domain-containing protein [Actinomycetota bacterium]
MKARNPLEVAVLRMALAGIKEARVSGADARELTDDEALAVLAKEAKRREEAAAAFAEGGRTESAEKELAERDVLARYLP